MLINLRICVLLLIFSSFLSCQPWDLEKLDISCLKVINLTGDLVFGKVTIGNSSNATLILRISNTGTCPLHIFAVSVPPGYSHNFTETVLIGPNEYLDVQISFNPENSGDYNGFVSITSNATSGISSVGISGEGYDPAVGGTGILSVSGDIEFGTVKQNTSVKKTIRIYNIGDATLTINSIQTDISTFLIPGLTLPFNLGKNDSLSIDLYMNTTFVGDFKGKISIFSSANNKIIQVAGSVIGNGVLTISGNGNFDTVILNSTAMKILTLTNTGTGQLIIDTIKSASSKFPISGLSTPFSLDVNQSQPLNINLNTSVPGTYSSNVSVLTNANDEIINVFGIVVDSSGNAGCPTTFIDTRDGELYKAKMLAGKCWMTENLRYDAPTAGDDSPYSDNPLFLKDYGRYYKWQTLMNGSSASNSNPSNVQGLCPNGWHIPSKDEIQDLLDYYGNDSGLAFNNLVNNGASGLKFQLGGCWIDPGTWFGFGGFGYYWTTSGNGGTASHILISYSYFQLSDQSVTFKMPCRCVK